MRFQSTRGQAAELGFDDVLLTGLARDGGLYLPVTWPERTADDWRAMRGLAYGPLATQVTKPFFAGSVVESDLGQIMDEAYAPFDHPAVAPLVQLASNTWLMELFHGPTLAFKDYALQVVGHLFDRVLSPKGSASPLSGRHRAIPALLPLRPVPVEMRSILLFSIPRDVYPKCSAAR